MRRSLYTTAEKEATTLRFAVGDKVLANTGEWTPGVVVRQWYQEKGWEVRASSAGGALVAQRTFSTVGAMRSRRPLRWTLLAAKKRLSTRMTW